MIDLNELKKTTLEIYKKRKENGANLGTDHLKHCAGEVIEAEKANIDIEKAILEVVEKNRLRAEGKGDKK